jgi:hypothetical protein
MVTVKVADFRNKIDHLFRVLNADFHACVNATELGNWERIAKRVYNELAHIECKRANDYDKEQRLKAMEAFEDQMLKSAARIQRYENKETA